MSAITWFQITGRVHDAVTCCAGLCTHHVALHDHYMSKYSFTCHVTDCAHCQSSLEKRRMHVGLTGRRSRMAILARMQRADAPPPSVGPDGGGPSASKGRDAWKSARGQTTRRVYSIEDVIIIIAHQKRFCSSRQIFRRSILSCVNCLQAIRLFYNQFREVTKPRRNSGPSPRPAGMPYAQQTW